MACIGAILLMLGSALAWLAFSLSAGLSFLAGGVLAGLNLLWLHRTVAAVVRIDPKGSKLRVLAGFFLRLLLLPLSLYVMIRFLFLNIPAAVAGFAVFNCSVFVEGIVEAFESTSRQ